MEKDGVKYNKEEMKQEAKDKLAIQQLAGNILLRDAVLETWREFERE